MDENSLSCKVALKILLFKIYLKKVSDIPGKLQIYIKLFEWQNPNFAGAFYTIKRSPYL